MNAKNLIKMSFLHSEIV